ncbi:MAG: hypothetical protein AB7G25_04615 [Sphingomonadaceae bacterium]
MNARRGCIRLAIAVIGGWVASWASVGGYAAWQAGIWTNIFIEASRARRYEELAYADERAQYYGELIATSIEWGALAIPIALAFLLGWWVYRGFCPDTAKS